MPAAEVAARVRESLKSVKAADLKDAQLFEVLRLAQQLTDTMQMFFGSLDQSIHDEFTSIAAYIAQTRNEIAQLRPNDIREQRIPIAGAELEAVVSDTERATEAIMNERLFEYFSRAAPPKPKTVDEMAPLYYAVAHGCRAGGPGELQDSGRRRDVPDY